MEKDLLLIIFCFIFHFIYAQDTTRPTTAEDLQMLTKNIDSAYVLAEMSETSCKCIDSIFLANRNNKDIVQDIKKCIDKEVVVYQMEMKLFATLKNGDKKATININANQNSDGYKKYYYEIERWLNDSCTAIRNAAAAYNKKSEHSMTNDPSALEQYNKGIAFMDKSNYADALPYFKKAVEIDSMFAFAWDNVGLCYRKTDNFDKALEAYQISLSIDPQGQMPLQNIAIVYEYQKEYDKELDAYKRLLEFYPDDPEVFYGIGRIYTFFKNDTEKGLDNFCKAYNLYVKLNSPYRTDAEKNISAIYGQMKKENKENVFLKILKDNNITPDKK